MKTREQAVAILHALERTHPDATCALDYRTPLELLVATILSAQCTDERVNQVTRALFSRYRTAADYGAADPARLEEEIKPTGFFRNKARTLIALGKALVDQFGGEVPGAMDALVTLPGVGRKTANVVLGHAFAVPGFAVDRHVLRVSNRVGLARSDDAEEVERQLTDALPRRMWTRASDTLIFHGRRICKPKPLCDRCSIALDCDYVRALKAGHAPLASPPIRRGAAPHASKRGARPGTKSSAPARSPKPAAARAHAFSRATARRGGTRRQR